MASTANKIIRDSTLQTLAAAKNSTKSSLESIYSQLTTRDGALSNLKTSAKNNIVSAINEVVTNESNNKTAMEPYYDIFKTFENADGVGDKEGLHNMFFRGKYLGKTITEEQSNNIKNASFKDIWLGDYWMDDVTFTYLDNQKEDAETTITIKDCKMRIASVDYWYGVAYPSLSRHNVIVVPDCCLYHTWMYSGGGRVDGGYANSDFKTKYAQASVDVFESFFGADHVLQHRDCFSTAVTIGTDIYNAGTGVVSGIGWFDTKVDLMDEMMVYGCLPHDSSSNIGSGAGGRVGPTKQPLQLFTKCPSFRSANPCQGYFLRNVVNYIIFAGVTYGGDCGTHLANDLPYYYANWKLENWGNAGARPFAVIG